MQSRSRIALIALELFVALNAFGGGYYGMSGAAGVPRKWLEGSPFNSYFVPSLILFVAVGGSFSAAAFLLWKNLGIARLASLASGVILLIWLLVETITIGYVSWLQPATFVAAVFTLLLAWRLEAPAAQLPKRAFSAH